MEIHRMKKRFEKVVSAVLACAMALALAAPAAFAETSFSDVASGAWYYTYVTDLTASGVVGGYPDGSFRPDSATTAGEALKLVLLAAGADRQEPTGTHWASGYLDYAVKKGYVASGDITDLNAEISRALIAKIAAKALDVKAAGTSPFADTDDVCATALYECGIITGSRNAAGEKVYLPDDGIKRSEISAIIWRINTTDVHKGQIKYLGEWLSVLDGVPVNSYRTENFSADASGRVTYSGQAYQTGVDVSSYQGTVDWNAVKADGIDFAFIRAGYRGWGAAGTMNADRNFTQNIQGATAAGLKVGVYFYSQAVTEAEAAEEAQFVLNAIAGYDVQYPVVFDWEVVGRSDARTYGLSSDALGKCANAFCSAVEAAGYKALIYVNKYSGYKKYDLRTVPSYGLWLAEYNTAAPTFYYDFKIWQYSDSGKVGGISGKADMDISFVDYSR
jgi:GH25 family lysozyme M1 (1,4-beta-N-acetylmuramidase)